MSATQADSYYYRVTLSYEVLVEGVPGEAPLVVAARAIAQEQLRTGLRYRVSAIDGVPIGSSDDGQSIGSLWDEL